MVTSISVPSFTIFDSMAITTTPNTNTTINTKNSININSNVNNENNPLDILNNNNRKRDGTSNTVSESKKLKISQQVLLLFYILTI
jgi:hypothetical protein